jgi:hypothetical protein
MDAAGSVLACCALPATLCLPPLGAPVATLVLEVWCVGKGRGVEGEDAEWVAEHGHDGEGEDGHQHHEQQQQQQQQVDVHAAVEQGEGVLLGLVQVPLALLTAMDSHANHTSASATTNNNNKALTHSKPRSSSRPHPRISSTQQQLRGGSRAVPEALPLHHHQSPVPIIRGASAAGAFPVVDLLGGAGVVGSMGVRAWLGSALVRHTWSVTVCAAGGLVDEAALQEAQLPQPASRYAKYLYPGECGVGVGVLLLITATHGVRVGGTREINGGAER